jgi:hypothetical protein
MRKFEPGDLIKITGDYSNPISTDKCILFCETDNQFDTMKVNQIGLVLEIEKSNIRNGHFIKVLINKKVYQICPGDYVHANNK